jgi:hypothetical protein
VLVMPCFFDSLVDYVLFSLDVSVCDFGVLGSLWLADLGLIIEVVEGFVVFC